MKPDGHTHMFGEAHVPPLRQASLQNAGKGKQTIVSLGGLLSMQLRLPVRVLYTDPWLT